jgi:hypothetical protein
MQLASKWMQGTIEVMQVASERVKVTSKGM